METIELLEEGQWQRRVTLDVSWHEVLSRASRAGIPVSHQKLPVPLAILPKGLFLDIDLTGEHGRTLPVLTSDQDSFAAQLVMAKKHEELFDSWPHALLLAEMFRAARAPSSSSSRLAEFPDTSDYISLFSDNFMMMTEIEPGAPTFIMKYRIHDAVEAPSQSLPSALCLTARQWWIDVPGVTQSQRAHVRVVAPAGMFVSFSHLFWDREDGQTYGVADHESRTAPHRSMIYAQALSDANHFVAAGVRVRNSGVLSALTLWAYGTLLVYVFAYLSIYHYRTH